jgi:lysyl-tRNA synthetase class 2
MTDASNTTPSSDWRSPAPLANLQARAALNAKIREFFAARHVLEVETPLLCHYGVTDLHIDNIEVTANSLFLQSSPEYAMKRLLAQHKIAMYQLGKAFRHNDYGRWHNPEFTLLEWYRPGFDHHQLMDEIDDLLAFTINADKSERISYQALFQTHVGIDPLDTTPEELLAQFDQANIHVSDAVRAMDLDSLLQLLMSQRIEPRLGLERPCFVYHYPQSQASLAKLDKQDPRVAARFELYYRGVELANGFHELADAKEQAQRFALDQAQRAAHQRPYRAIDPRLLGALDYGIPDTAGVALGIDRLLMLACHANALRDVLSFSFDLA